MFVAGKVSQSTIIIISVVASIAVVIIIITIDIAVLIYRYKVKNRYTQSVLLAVFEHVFACFLFETLKNCLLQPLVLGQSDQLAVNSLAVSVRTRSDPKNVNGVLPSTCPIFL